MGNLPLSARNVGGVVLAAFTQHMHRRGLAPSTIRNRVRMIRRLEEHTGVSCIEVTAIQLEAWLDDLNLSATTRYRYVSHLHVFYQWAVAWDYTTHDPTLRVVRPKLPRYLPRPIPEPDLAIAVSGASGQMRGWLLLAAYAGLRAAEIAGLHWSDIDPARQIIRVRGKGNKDRLIPAHPVILEELDRPHRPGPIFTRRDGHPWPPQKVSYYAARHMRRLGVNATLHQLRHRFATQTYAACHDLRLVQELMGHASITTTAGYVAWHQPAGAAAVHALTV